MSPADEEVVHAHYAGVFGLRGARYQRPEGFSILVFAPTEKRAMFTYGTAGLLKPGDGTDGLELHLVAPEESDGLVELLANVASGLRDARVSVGHTVSLGRPWLPGSKCDHGLVSLPYLDGPPLENLQTAAGRVQCLWLLPITEAEADYKAAHGLESLEAIFEENELDYLDPSRDSLA